MDRILLFQLIAEVDRDAQKVAKALSGLGAVAILGLGGVIIIALFGRWVRRNMMSTKPEGNFRSSDSEFGKLDWARPSTEDRKPATDVESDSAETDAEAADDDVVTDDDNDEGGNRD